MDPARRRRLLTLVELAEANSPNACWDDRRAIELLRKDATREELEELGIGAAVLDYIFRETHER